MARMRMIKPEMRKSLTVSSWPIPVRWTFVGLLGYVDDYGRGLDELRLIKAELYPLDDAMTGKKIDAHLHEIAGNGPLCRYEVDGVRYLHVPSWGEHQKVSHPSPSRIPSCPVHDKDGNDSRATPEALANDSGTIPPRARAGARGSGIREQGSGIAPEGAAPESVTPLRARNELWDAVVEVCGIDPSAITEAGRGHIATAVKQLKAVDATPAQITLRARNYREQYRDANLTPMALTKHWAALGNDHRPPAGDRPQDIMAALSRPRNPS